MKIEGCVALVTGSNRGIGLGFVKVLLERGARKVYATARDPSNLQDVVALDPARISGFALDIDDDAQRLSVAEQTGDTSLLINNAGISGSENEDERRALRASSLQDARQVMETDCFSPIEMCRLYLPDMIKRGEGGGYQYPVHRRDFLPAFARELLRRQGRAGHPDDGSAGGSRRNRRGYRRGFIRAGCERAWAAANTATLVSPEEHAREVFDAFEAGERHIFAGARAGDIRDAVLADPGAFEQAQIERFRNPEKAWD